MPFQKGNTIRNTGKTRFKKGHVSWNMGLPIQTNTGRTHFAKGDINIQNENHPQWKGDGVSYVGLHQWVRRKLGRPIVCRECGATKNVQWANKSHEYKRDLEDWIGLCRSCHMVYDNIMQKSWATRRARL